MTYYLVVVDTTQIQPYIFGSNRLRENMGASYLVEQATGEWAFSVVDTLPEVAKQHNLRRNARGDWEFADDRRIEVHNLAAEVVYAGGGNFVVLFRELATAQTFTQALSRRVLTDAPNLQLVGAHQPVEWGPNALQRALGAALVNLAQQKRTRPVTPPALGLGVSVPCGSTGLPATGMAPSIGGDPRFPASTEILMKHEAVWDARRRLHRMLPLPDGYQYPIDFEDLGATHGEFSHIAVVHADGDGMGERIRQLAEMNPDPRDYISVMRDFSQTIREAGQVALQYAFDLVMSNALQIRAHEAWIVYQPVRTAKPVVEFALAKNPEGGFYVPFTPLVYGGDDVTFVADGRLGLALGLAFLRAFARSTAVSLAPGLSASAGVAIVKSHYPFARAYDLAAELMDNAKDYRRELKDGTNGGCLDWHFALSGLGGRLREIRKREYFVQEGWLTLRPVTLGANPLEPRHAWPMVARAIGAFQGPDWIERRTKVKALRDALRTGPIAVEHFRAAFNENQLLPSLLPDRAPNWSTRGWEGADCGYFDAIELADWFVPLEEEEKYAP